MSDYERPAREPDAGALDRFWQAATERHPELSEPGTYSVRMIGWDAATTEQVLELIARREKTGTYSLPWLIERGEREQPAEGSAIVFVDFEGNPRLLVRLTDIEAVTFREIDERHTAIDGIPVRAVDVWKPLHTSYWNPMLARYGLEVTDEMPVLVERFELLDI